MHSRFHRNIAALIAAPLVLGGCVQATRHSNTMIFGTNTSFGLSVGTDTAQVPTIVVGYKRQEAVIMPLVANSLGAAASAANINRLDPCDLTKPVTVTGGQFAVHPCSLVAVNGKALDSYSVLASFGATYDASGSGAKGGLAQYFATGIAAQLLAATGGASVVATGDAAKASAEKAPLASSTIASLYGNEPAFKLGASTANDYDKFVDRLLAKITLTDAAQLKAKVAAFETAAKAKIKVADKCDKPDVCKKVVRDSYALDYLDNKSDFETALTAWQP